MTVPPATASTTQSVDVGACSLSVTTFGEADRSLLLLHGVGSRGVSWWPVIDQLAAHFRVIVPDLRGHGASDKPTTGYDLHDYAADLQGLIEAVALDQPAIIGHSLGGVITLTWAVNHGDATSRIVLEDTPLRGDRNAGSRFAEWIALASMTVDEATAFYRQTYPDWTEDDCRRRAESITATAPGVFAELRDQMIAGADLDRIAPLAAVRTPMLLIHGDFDTGSYVVPSDAQRFVETAPEASAVRIPGGGHSLHRDKTEEFLAAAMPFLLGAN